VNLVPAASVVVKGFVIEDDHATAHRLFAIDAVGSAPSRLPIEVANRLCKKVHRGAFTPEAATEAVHPLAHLPIRSVDTADLAAATFALATRLDHPAEDGCDLAVAEAEDERAVALDVVAQG